MADKQPMQADGDGGVNADDNVGLKPGNGESAGGAYPHSRKPKPFSGGQSEQSYEGPDNPIPRPNRMDPELPRSADLPPEAGKLPAFARPVDPEAGREIGTDDTYSGQEYDGASQEAWRAEQRRHALPSTGEVHGSGAGAGGGNPGEDFDDDTTSGGGSFLNTKDKR